VTDPPAPGIGPVIATAIAATVPAATSFRSGRHLAAWLGLVPGQHASGGKERRLGLSKRSAAYLRRQLIHGARVLVKVSPGRTGKLWAWINALRQRRPFDVVVAAVANKLARQAPDPGATIRCHRCSGQRAVTVAGLPSGRQRSARAAAPSPSPCSPRPG
jgi:transposase